jgi:hypothetical protein
MSSEPIRPILSNDWEHAELYRRVKEALYALPTYFRTTTYIEGIAAIDIFTLNSALGATIENQVVNTLNQMRPVWDPNDKYLLYSFVRQSQTFPDVLLKKQNSDVSVDTDIILGIELKGWYLLAKEAEPSFRFQVTPSACANADMIAVVPWALNNVISGSPQIFSPYVESAKYAAEYRNYHWQKLRQTTSSSKIEQPGDISPYPKKSDKISDKPAFDSGGNFGRFARAGIMDEYLIQARSIQLSGISAQHWLDFFKIFRDQKSSSRIHQEILKLRNKLIADSVAPNQEYSPIEIILLQLEKISDESIA